MYEGRRKGAISHPPRLPRVRPGILTFERPPSGLAEVQTPAHPFTAKAGLKLLPPSAYPFATIEACPASRHCTLNLLQGAPLGLQHGDLRAAMEPFNLAPDAAEGTAGRSSTSGVVHSSVL